MTKILNAYTRGLVIGGWRSLHPSGKEHKDEITDIVIKSDDAVNKLLIALKFIAEVAMDRAGFQILLNDGDKAQKLSKSVMYIHMAHRLFQDYSVGIENDDLQEVFMLR